MTSKKTRISTVLLLSFILTIGFMTGCGKKEADTAPKTSIKEVNGEKVKVTENGDGAVEVQKIEE
ncbi:MULTISPECIES: hypothetical protein [Enterococcus]|jgi:hypothetical protein|uniref:hypothetical protein n=1 Tax=Enterococcus TaxID=1350 RepID=UPI002DC028B8|nr:hypothetical protein [Enterococcus faecalis]MEB8383851.1 hypothetical protein [Enterococcus faecalis]